ncbi:MAG: helix-turn-helix domain-containing protein [Butyrivibrio sp.]|nr:helix-turn-helix domain-containing protein [Butyrivibrio sp.]
MARKGKTISVPEEDIPVLEAMKASPDESLALPAKIILELRDNPIIKNASNILEISESTIYKWRDRYLEAGIDGLYPRKHSPKMPSLVEDSVSALIESSDSDKSWTAKELAEHLDIAPRQARRAMKRLGIPAQRNRSWICQTVERDDSSNPYIVGLYLSYDVKVIIFSTLTDRDLCGWTLRGRMITYSSSLNHHLDMSATQLSMMDTLVTATELADIAVHTKGMKPGTFIETVVEEWQEVSDATLYIYTCADKPPAYHGTRLKGVIFGHVPDYNKWLHKVWDFTWCIAPQQLSEVASKANAIDSFLKNCKEESSPFIWYLLYSQSGREPASESKPDELPVFAGKYDSLEEALSSVLPNAEMDPEKQECAVVLVSRNEDGKNVYSITRSNTGLPPTATFDLTTEEGFERSINSLDQCATALGVSVDIGARRFYLDNVKKNQKGS